MKSLYGTSVTSADIPLVLGNEFHATRVSVGSVCIRREFIHRQPSLLTTGSSHTCRL